MLPYDMLLFLLIGAALGGFVMGLVGFGTGLAAYGFWLFVIDPSLAVPLVGICSLTTTIFTLKAYSHAISFQRLAPFFLGAVFGLPLGVFMLTRLDPVLFKLGIGCFLIVYTSFRLFVMPGLRVAVRGQAADAGVGAIGGFFAGLAAMPGPITTMWCGLRDWSKDEQRGVFQPFNQTIMVLAMAGYAYEGLFTRELGLVALYCVPGTLTGMAIGMIGYKRLDENQFQKAVLLLLLASGFMLVLLNAMQVGDT